MLRKIIKHRNNPDVWVNFIQNELLWRIFKRIFGNDSNYILEKNWDYLFILDACRYDLFQEVNWLEGEERFIRSRGSDTKSFLDANFGHIESSEIVYVTANPVVNNINPEKFADVISVWKYEWDEEKSTVKAKDMVDYCLDAMERYTDKRFIFHFLQPHLSHTQHLTSEEGKLKELPGKLEDFKDKSVLRKFLEGKISKRFPTRGAWVLLQENEVNEEAVWDLQVKKLKKGLDAIEDILQFCDGKTVITSDHGNAYGEKLHHSLPWRVYEHPPNLPMDELIKVPWFKPKLN